MDQGGARCSNALFDSDRRRVYERSAFGTTRSTVRGRCAQPHQAAWGQAAPPRKTSQRL